MQGAQLANRWKTPANTQGLPLEAQVATLPCGRSPMSSRSIAARCGWVKQTTVVLSVLVASYASGETRASFKADRLRATKVLSRLAGPGKLTVRWAAHRTRPAMIRGFAFRATGATDAERVRRFLTDRPELFVSGNNTLEQVDVRETRDLRVFRFRQLYRGLVVDGATVSVALDRAGLVRVVHSEVEPVSLSSTRPGISGAAAVERARMRLGSRSRAPASTQLVVVPGVSPRLAFRVLLPENPARFHFIDASSGARLGARRAAIVELSR